jgi:hypothetical protein
MDFDDQIYQRLPGGVKLSGTVSIAPTHQTFEESEPVNMTMHTPWTSMSGALRGYSDSDRASCFKLQDRRIGIIPWLQFPTINTVGNGCGNQKVKLGLDYPVRVSHHPLLRCVG